MSAPSAERLAMLAEMSTPRRIAEVLPDGEFRNYVTALLSAEVEDVEVWLPLFEARVDLLYVLIARDAGVADLAALATAWTDGIPVDYAVAALRSEP